MKRQFYNSLITKLCLQNYNLESIWIYKNITIEILFPKLQKNLYQVKDDIMKKTKSKFVCIFDKSHQVDTQQKLISHMKKCKALQKQSYELCPYNGLHWIKFDSIQQHLKNCNDKTKQFPKVLPEQISRIQLEIPFDVNQSMIGDTNFSQNLGLTNQNHKNQNKIKAQKHQMKKKGERKVQQNAKKLWLQPNFLKFIQKKGYKRNKNSLIRGNDNQINVRGENAFDNQNSFLF